MKQPFIFAVSGVKNSGKTTLITKLLPLLIQRGLKVATIKHDGHDFEADVPGTDTYRHLQAGACGTIVYSKNKYMLVKQQPKPELEEMIGLFPEVDLILLEGLKRCDYPKLEVIRKGNSSESVCAGYQLRAIATDIEDGLQNAAEQTDVVILDLNRPEKIADFIYWQYRMYQNK